MCSHRQSPDKGGFLRFRYPALPDVRNNETFNWMLGKDLSLELLPPSVERVLSFLPVFICRERVDCRQFGCFGPGWRTSQGCCGTQQPPAAPGSCCQLRPGPWEAALCIFSKLCHPVLKPSGAEQPSFLPLSAKSRGLLSSSGEPQAQQFAPSPNTPTPPLARATCVHT